MTDRPRQILYYAAGFLICSTSLLFRLFLLQYGAEPPPGPLRVLQPVIGALPWIAVAIVLVLWRARRGQRVHPAAFLAGIATPLVLAYLWLRVLAAA